jgi:hypothetical protein
MKVPMNSNLRRFVNETLIADSALKHQFNEAYVTRVLGIDRNVLVESRGNNKLQVYILREHFLFEGWWSSAAEFVGDSIENIKQKAAVPANALKTYGRNAKGVIAAMAAAVTDPDKLDTFKNGLQQLMKKRAKTILKYLHKLIKRLDELNMGPVSKIVKALIAKLENARDNMQASGWKGLLTAAAGLLGFSWLAENVMPVLRKIHEMTAGDITRAAAQGVKDIIVDELTDMLIGMLGDMVGKLIGSSLTSLAGPAAWLKQAYDIFGGSAFVLDKLASGWARGNF